LRFSVITCVALLVTVPVFAQQSVAIKGRDGFALQGTYFSAGKVGPGVVLLHPCDADRRIYDRLADFLSTAGYNVLSFDLRGTGASRSGDIDAALMVLLAQKDVNTSRLGIIAADCAVGPAVQAAGRQTAVKALVLISGAVDAVAEAHVKASKLPVLGIASEGDSHADGLKRIVEASANPDSMLALLKGAGNSASAILAGASDFETDIIIWLRASFPVASYAPLK
jgi:pimeloyl-ACP methyl ester carboxylesterase